MSERIINAEVEGTELEALSSLLLVLLPKKDKGMRPVAIANTMHSTDGESICTLPR